MFSSATGHHLNERGHCRFAAQDLTLEWRLSSTAERFAISWVLFPRLVIPVIGPRFHLYLLQKRQHLLYWYLMLLVVVLLRF